MAGVLNISEAASLALHTMVLLAGNTDGLLSVGRIASALGVSKAHLSKVLQRLARAGLVRSVRGPRGGFALDKAPEQITLLDVYELIEGPLSSGKCLLSRPICGGEHCILGRMLVSVNEQVRRQLAASRLSELTDSFWSEYSHAAEHHHD